MYCTFLRFQSLDMDKKYFGKGWHLLGQHLVFGSRRWTPKTFAVLQNPVSYWTLVRGSVRRRPSHERARRLMSLPRVVLVAVGASFLC